MALRVAAGVAVVCWLGSLALCNIERALGWDDCSPDEHAEGATHQAVVAHNHPGESHDPDDVGNANHSHDADGHSGHHHDGEDSSCCSTLKGVVQTAQPIVISKPAVQPLTFLCVLPEARDLSLLAPETAPGRQTKSREWVFTPEVCTGSANRSHAPPVFI
jgi:hypothetical protein